MDYSKFELSTERLVLKVLDASFAETVKAFYERNREFHKEWDPERNEEFFTLDFQQKMLQNELYKINNDSMFKVWIFNKEDEGFERIIGFVSLSNFVRGVFQSCHLSYKMDKDEINKGYITEAIKVVAKFAFYKLQLHRIEANIIPRNARSIRVVEKLGFENEGLSRKYLKINGKWEDHVHMVLLNESME